MKKINLHLLAVFIIPLLVYFFTMPLSVALEDDGLFIMSSYFNGVSHPPGYPLHSLFGKLFTLIPISTIPARVHAVSAFFGALSCVILWLLIHELLKNKLFASAGAFAFAFSNTFWSQAIISEVYTLNTFFFFSLFYLVLKIGQFKLQNSDHKSNQLTYFTAFVFGLSLCNHWPLMLLSAPALLILLWPTLKSSPSILFKSLPFIALGLTPYIWLVYNSQTNPVISFAGSIDSWEEFIKIVSRMGYAKIDASSSAGLTDKFEFLLFYLVEFLGQFTYLGFLFISVGLYAQLKYITKPLAIALFTAFFFNSFLLILLLNFDYDLFHQSIISVYFLSSYGIASIWLAIGLHHSYILFSKYKLSLPFFNRAFTAACCSLLIIIFVSNISKNYRHDYDWGERYANTVLNTLPKDAVIILEGDMSVTTIGYTHFIDSIRPDVTLISERALVFPTRLYDPLQITHDEALPILKEYIDKETRPLHNIGTPEIYSHNHWLTKSFDANMPGDRNVIYPSALDENYLRYIYEYNNKHDIWTNIHRTKLLIDSIPFVIEAKLAGRSDELFDAVIKEMMGDLDGLLTIIDYLSSRRALDSFGGLDLLVSKAESLFLVSSDKMLKSNYLLFRGLLKKQQGNLNDYHIYLISSINMWPNINNSAFRMLGKLYTSYGRSNEFNELILNFDDSVVEKYSLH